MKNDSAALTRLHQSNLNLLVNLAVLLDEAHVSRAAERLGMTQSAISHVLNRARDLFNDPLLIKGSQGMILTRRAQALRQQLVDFAQTTSQVFQGAEFDPSTAKGIIRFSMNDLAASLCIEALLQIFAEQAPLIELEYISPSESMIGQLNKGALDLVIGPFSCSSKHCHSLKLGSEPWHLLQTAQAMQGNKLNQASYTLAEQLDLPLAPPLLQQQLAPATGFSSSSLLMILAAIQTQKFNALIPQCLLQMLPEANAPLPYSLTSMGNIDSFMLWPEHSDNQPLHIWVRGIFMRIYQQHVLLTEQGS